MDSTKENIFFQGWPWFSLNNLRVVTMYGLEILQQYGKRVKTKYQKVLQINYQGAFCTPLLLAS